MLSSGRAISQLSRITRQGHHIKNISRIVKRFDLIHVGCLKYSSKIRKGKHGSTVKVEECVPKTKTFKKVPPLPSPPPLPPPPPTPPPPSLPLPHISVPPESSKKHAEHAQPLCEDRTYSCPPTCPPVYQQDCYKPPSTNSGSGNGSEFKYWKHVVAALLLAGFSAFTYLQMPSQKEEKKQKTDKTKTKFTLVKKPKESTKIPDEVPYLLIGGGTAAFSAFRAIKANDPTAKVLFISNESDLPYMRPPLSKELWYNKDESMSSKLMFQQWNGAKRSLFYEPHEFYLDVSELLDSENGGAAVATGWTVKEIDVLKKVVYLEDDKQIKYEKCLIATGASPKNLPVFEKAEEKVKEKILPFRTKEDYLQLVNNMKDPDVKNIVVIGGGLLGSELSTSLARNLNAEDQSIYQIYKEKYIMAQVLPEYLSKWTTKHSEKEGVNCMPNLEVHDVRMIDNQITITLTDGQMLKADQIIVAIGVEANTALADASDLELDPDQGGFLVNAELEARSNLWVAGDAACFYDVKLGRRRIEHHDHAVISGKLAGENMTGARKPYLHQSMFWSDLGPEVGFEAIGIIDSSLGTVGVFAKITDDNNNDDTASIEEESTKSQIQTKSLSTVKVNFDVKNVENTIGTNEQNAEKKSAELDNYGKGVIFYLRNNVVVGIVLWNLFNRMSVARQLLARGTTYDELNEAAKLFAIHED